MAAAANRAIGKDNTLLWHISDDLRRFKSLTMGHPVIMGRRTFLSLPKRPLPKRRNIVLTHDSSFESEGVEVAHTVARVFDLVRQEEESFVIGGESIYQQFLPFAQRLYVTWVDRDFDADAYFPAIDSSCFRLIHQTAPIFDSESGLTYSYAEYKAILQDIPKVF